MLKSLKHVCYPMYFNIMQTIVLLPMALCIYAIRVIRDGFDIVATVIIVILLILWAFILIKNISRGKKILDKYNNIRNTITIE